ncbi:mannosyltransferase family protein [Phenylobacterium sp.]|uniref:mannosyltransferase family protein n=1 Tax=Phenylobacterium sp. TaxID=1871053 RepID=UPI003569DAC6
MTTGFPRSFRTIALIWLGWAVIMLAYQAFAPARLPLERPDRATSFSADETGPGRLKGRPYLSGAFLNTHVAWDSEYYLSIALHGYDDPQMRAVSPASTAEAPVGGLQREHPTWTSINYAFFPAYPFAIRALAAPLGLVGLDPVAAATLAGVLISLAGALAGMWALSDLAGERADDAIRAGFYLLIWPASIFLAQVYTEGLFVGLSFGALAMMGRRKWVLAAVLAAFATWTRATGGLLLIPFVWTWLADGGLRRLRSGSAVTLVLAAAPAIAYLAWRAILGARFGYVEAHYFGRGLLQLRATAQSFADLIDFMQEGDAQARAYYAVEGLAVLAAAVCSAVLWRSHKAVALYGAAILAVALTSGAALGLPRYVIAVPALFLAPARWGRSVTFDRLWSLASILGLAVFGLAFSLDFWAG